MDSFTEIPASLQRRLSPWLPQSRLQPFSTATILFVLRAIMGLRIEREKEPQDWTSQHSETAYAFGSREYEEAR
jgi:hypothetical protein